MSGRDRLFSTPQEDLLVRQVVDEFFRKNDPEKLDEVDDVFDLVHAMVDDRIGEPRVAGERSVEGIAALSAFFTGTLVTTVIWVATHLYRQTQAPPTPAAPVARSLDAMLAEVTGNPQMVRELHERISLLQGIASLAAGEGAAGDGLRNVKRRIAEDLPPVPEVPYRTAVSEAPATIAGSGPGPEPDLKLLVTGRADLEGPLHFRLHAKDPGLGLVYSDHGEVHAGIYLRSYVAELKAEVARLQDLGRAGRAEAGRRMERLGERLAEQLLPEKLAMALESLRGKACSLIVYADAFIPWELLRFPDRPGRPGAFFGAEFAITRWFTGSPQVFELPLRRIALVAPRSDLAAATVEARAVLGLQAPGRRVTALPAGKGRLLAELFPSDFDAIHFAGHGMSPPGQNPDFGRLLLEDGDFFDAIDLPRHGLGARPLVFLNACHSGDGGPLPTSIGGLARAFVAAGAGAVVGAHWAIDDVLAEIFAGELYQRLFAGLPLAEAVRRARLRLAEERPGDPTWIAYTVFGQPGAACPALPSGS